MAAHEWRQALQAQVRPDHIAFSILILQALAGVETSCCECRRLYMIFSSVSMDTLESSLYILDQVVLDQGWHGVSGFRGEG